MKKHHNPTLRVINILNLVSHKNNLTLSEISKELNVSKSTIQPILKTLLDFGYLSQDANSKFYQIGINTFRLGQSYLKAGSINMIKSSMKKIVEECNEICQLGICDKENPGYVFYIAKEEPVQAVTLISSIGASIPAHSTALGKCLLSSFSEDYIRDLYKNGMKQITAKTITNIEEFLVELNEIRKNGYAIEIGESSDDIECVAVPLEQDNEIIASLSVSIPKFRSTPEKIEKIIKLLLKYKNDLDDILIGNHLKM